MYLDQFELVRTYDIQQGRLYLHAAKERATMEFKSMSELPVAATVLGKEVRTDESAVMQEEILSAIFGQYVVDHNLQATDEEIDAFIEDVARTMREDRESRSSRLAEVGQLLRSQKISSEQRTELESERSLLEQTLASPPSEAPESPAEAEPIRQTRRTIATGFVERWKMNRALYQKFGGRIVFQQAGPEPLDAYRSLLKEREAAGGFKILRSEWVNEFWRYFTDDSMHSFVEPGSEREKEVFATPPWNK